MLVMAWNQQFNVCEKVEVLIFYSDSSSHDEATILLGLEAGNGVLCEEVVAFLELNPEEYFDTILIETCKKGGKAPHSLAARQICIGSTWVARKGVE